VRSRPTPTSSRVSSPRSRTGPGRRHRGFTLIETALTTVIIGVGVLALIEAQQTFLRATAWSSHAATATHLANEVRELTRKLPRHDPVTGLYFDENNVLRGWGPETGESALQDLDDIDDFDGLRLSFEGTPGVADADLPGPIDGFGSVIPEVLNDGTVLLDVNGNPMPLRGWAQVVLVEKIDPFNTGNVLDPAAVVAPQLPDFEGVPVDKFPLRVTVEVRFLGPYDTAEETIATVVWIVP
jgi:prepilin-type N-terminal cleavage/methylation domain-containing protein